jgi:hypothetical protein
MLAAFAKVGWDESVVTNRVGKPLLDWQAADVKKARELYRQATESKGATI